MSKEDKSDLLRLYDATAAWLRDCSRKGDAAGTQKATSELKGLDTVWFVQYEEAT
jgi:hypothetical protein